MKLALTVRYGHDEEMILAQQLGADAVIVRFDLGDPQDTDLNPVAHRVRVAGLELAGVELIGMSDQFQPWSDGLTGALLAAQNADVGVLFCGSPVEHVETLAEDLAAVVATATATGVQIALDSACLLPEEIAWLPAGNVHIELALGVPPLEARTEMNDQACERVRAGGVSALRFEGGGRPLGCGGLDIPSCLAALAEAGFGGWVRAGAAPLLAEDEDWHPKGAANDLGYLRAMLQTLASRG